MIYLYLKARLHAIQVDPGTYLSEPNGPEDLFQAWLKEFNMDDKKGHISEVLVTSVEVRALYTKLVNAFVKSKFYSKPKYFVFVMLLIVLFIYLSAFICYQLLLLSLHVKWLVFR